MKKIIIAMLAVFAVGGMLTGCGKSNILHEANSSAESIVSEQVSETSTGELTKTQKQANTIIDKINGIGTVTVEKADTIRSIKKEYDKASDAVKNLVTNISKLQTAETKLTYMEKCESYSLKEALNNPDGLAGKYAKFTGQVIQVIDGDDYVELIVGIVEGESNADDNTIYVTYKKRPNENMLMEGDFVTFYGKLSGLHTYETRAIHNVTVPLLNAHIAVVQEN